MVTGPGVQLHQPDMRRLVQGIEREPAPGVGNGLIELVPTASCPADLLQGAGQIAATTFGLEELPVIELGAVTEGEARQEIIAIERHRLIERGQTRGTGLGHRVGVRPDLGEQRVEAIDIDPEAGTSAQADALSIGE